ncbi:MAG: zinc-dependent peptidase [Flavobacteriales bacterium]|nr:zinc-dependent peptidase [Bacteroidota bacterium]MCB9241477.1 zinc-dependent peptidase [Flavobacteriales bacterium]
MEHFFLIGSVAIAVLGLVTTLKEGYRKFRLERSTYVSGMDDVIKSTVIRYGYYKNLSEEGRLRFIKRVRYLCMEKNFIGMDGLEITDQMRVLICAEMVRITFGRKRFKLGGFTTIRLYPGIFYSRLIKRNVKGLTGRGFLALSWPDFLLGIEHPDDNLNLGLHEIAHALHIASFKGMSDMAEFQEYFGFWSRGALPFFQEMRQGEHDYLREYGSTNFHEFFAVVIEHFFETPEEFCRQIPELYWRTAVLLNQDPMQRENDYRLKLPETATTQQKSRLRTPYSVSVDWGLMLTIIGILFSLPMMLLLTMEATLNFMDRAVITSILGGFGIVLYPILHARGMIKHLNQYMVFCVFGIGMNLFAVLVWINTRLPRQAYEEEHVVLYENSTMREGMIRLQFADHAFDDYPNIRTIEGRTPGKESKRLVLKMEKGVLGYSERVDYYFR